MAEQSGRNKNQSTGNAVEEPGQELNRALSGLGIEVLGPVTPEFGQILTPQALAFVAKLSREFSGRRESLLQKRIIRQQEIDSGKLPDFLPETASIRAGSWTISPVPRDLQDRRVEITGPVDRKMVINALNSGAKVF